ncbi:hypothetical protein BMA721280_I0232 [Burkholderia mallei 2002721280]|nr:hypothetical protein BMA721280_I0232 [Burkholderia mallei 2002721280]
MQRCARRRSDSIRQSLVVLFFIALSLPMSPVPANWFQCRTLAGEP